jgi:hypothetical protein
MENTGRLFNCLLCRSQCVICTCCDRGNIYCSSSCSSKAREKSLQLAGHRYQNSYLGRLKHAQRQKRYRERQIKKVTHQGSSLLPDNDLLPSKPNQAIKHQEQTASDSLYCCFCSKKCSLFLRTGFLVRNSRKDSRLLTAWPLAP